MTKGFDKESIRDIIFNRLPESMQNNVEIVGTILKLIEDNSNGDVEEEELVYLFIDKFFSSMEYFDTGEVATEDYAYSCKFVSYLMLGYDEGQAYEFTFPRKAQILFNKGNTEYSRRLATSGRVFRRRSMVSKIMDIALVPIYVTNAPVLQESVDMLVHLMRSKDTSDYLKKDCAMALLKELKQPEVLMVKQEIDVKIDSGNLLEQFKKANASIASTTVQKISGTDNTITDVDAIFKDMVGEKE